MQVTQTKGSCLFIHVDRTAAVKPWYVPLWHGIDTCTCQQTVHESAHSPMQKLGIDSAHQLQDILVTALSTFSETEPAVYISCNMAVIVHVVPFRTQPDRSVPPYSSSMSLDCRQTQCQPKVRSFTEGKWHHIKEARYTHARLQTHRLQA